MHGRGSAHRAQPSEFGPARVDGARPDRRLTSPPRRASSVRWMPRRTIRPSSRIRAWLAARTAEHGLEPADDWLPGLRPPVGRADRERDLEADGACRELAKQRASLPATRRRPSSRPGRHWEVRLITRHRPPRAARACCPRQPSERPLRAPRLRLWRRLRVPCPRLWRPLRAPRLRLWRRLRAPCLRLWRPLRAPCPRLWRRLRAPCRCARLVSTLASAARALSTTLASAARALSTTLASAARALSSSDFRHHVSNPISAPSSRLSARDYRALRRPRSPYLAARPRRRTLFG